ncbi:unnamed protein product [Paramecium sonneborni]|uniref:Protein kinase domain-containing protein n=1 Tax=Paramecium sonneborni TaxID=65129 RepID=A0A8S1NVB9_9CILI|nr:unnamed protein product [Paramecium sonneborni]
MVFNKQYINNMLNKQQPYDFSLDVQSLAIVLYELVCGNATFRGRNNEKLCYKIKSGQPINLHLQYPMKLKLLLKQSQSIFHPKDFL